MATSQQNHIVATVGTALGHLADVRQVALTGQSSDGTLYMPLPEPERDRVVAIAERVSMRLRAAAANIDLAGSSDLERRKSLSATRMWLSTLLYMVLEQAEDLDPERVSRRYGTLSPPQRAELTAALDEVTGLLREALDVL